MIDPAAQDLLRACLLQGSAARDAFSAWKRHASPQDMEGRYVRLMPLLYRNLQHLGIDDALLPWLRGLAKHTWLTASLRLQVVLKEIAALHDANIPVVLIKGTALLARWPEAMDTRVAADIDLLVPAERALDALRIFRANGWTVPPPEFVSAIDFQKFHAFGLLRSPNLWIDVHWRPSAAIGDPELGRAVLARSLETKLEHISIRVVDLTDHLFLLLAHAFVDAAEARIDWAAELAFILRQRDAKIDWGRFDGLVRQYWLDDWRHRAFGFVETVAEIALPKAAFGNSNRHPYKFLERREYFARAKKARSPLDELLCQFGDVCRGERGALRQVLDANVLAQAARFPVLRHLLTPAVCFRLIKLSHARADDLALIPLRGLDLTRDPPENSFLSGWSYGEPIGRWTDAQAAWALFRVPAHVYNLLPVRMRLGTASSPKGPILRAKAWAGDKACRWEFGPAPCWGEYRTITGRVRHWAGARILPLFIEFEGNIDRESRGRTDPDGRSIGLLLSRIEFAHLTNVSAFDELDLVESGSTDRILWSGWGHAEPAGRWTVGHEARLLLNLSNRTRSAKALRLYLSAVFTAGPGIPQPVQAFVNGTPSPPTLLHIKEVPPYLDVPLSETTVLQDELVDIRLRIGRPISPYRLAMSNDRRELGIMIKSLSLID